MILSDLIWRRQSYLEFFKWKPIFYCILHILVIDLESFFQNTTVKLLLVKYSLRYELTKSVRHKM